MKSVINTPRSPPNVLYITVTTAAIVTVSKGESPSNTPPILIAASVTVATEPVKRLEPQALNDTDLMTLRVVGDDAKRQAVLIATLDNLGKGASGAAVQNLALMTGR